jgi:hypothetical protein
MSKNEVEENIDQNAKENDADVSEKPKQVQAEKEADKKKVIYFTL